MAQNCPRRSWWVPTFALLTCWINSTELKPCPFLFFSNSFNVPIQQFKTLFNYLIVTSLSEHSFPDECVWVLEKSRTQSTKTGYAVAKMNVEGKQDGFDWTKYVWNVACFPKICHFFWKLKQGLFSRKSLMKQGLQVEGKCKRCGECESVIHAMFICPFARKLWASTPS